MRGSIPGGGGTNSGVSLVEVFYPNQFIGAAPVQAGTGLLAPGIVSQATGIGFLPRKLRMLAEQVEALLPGRRPDFGDHFPMQVAQPGKRTLAVNSFGDPG